MEGEGPRILLVDDERSIRDILSVTLKPAGYRVYPVCTGEEALQTFQSARPDLVLLDLFLPDIDGKDLIRRLREWTATPIIVMSVRHEESEKIRSLDAGADDYLTKPFTMGEMLARLRAVLRRALSLTPHEVFTVGNLHVDFIKRTVLVGDDPVKLTATEYDLLKVLASHCGLVRTHHQLVRELWGTTRYQDPVHLLRVTVSNLRRKLVSDLKSPRYIVTEPGVGYRLRNDFDLMQELEGEGRSD